MIGFVLHCIGNNQNVESGTIFGCASPKIHSLWHGILCLLVCFFSSFLCAICMMLICLEVASSIAFVDDRANGFIFCFVCVLQLPRNSYKKMSAIIFHFWFSNGHLEKKKHLHTDIGRHAWFDGMNTGHYVVVYVEIFKQHLTYTHTCAIVKSDSGPFRIISRIERSSVKESGDFDSWNKKQIPLHLTLWSRALSLIS